MREQKDQLNRLRRDKEEVIRKKTSIGSMKKSTILKIKEDEATRKGTL